MLPDSSISLPISVKEAKSGIFSLSSTALNSLSNLGSAAIMKELLKSIVGDGVLKETIKQISLNAFGKISILNQSPLKEFMVKKGRLLIFSSLGEVTENMLHAGR